MKGTDFLPNLSSPLSSWLSGEQGVIEAILGTHRLAVRLREVGAVPGAPVRVLRTGCPTIIQVGSSRFCLRRADAMCIRVNRAA
jgi:Fe2+ transport system protein FeoA